MEENANFRIGLFDSGVGGLTVLRQLNRLMPQESLLYFGDTARLPYGTKSPAEILLYVRQIIDWMLTQQVKMVIMACNTSSALALEAVQKEYDIPILGLILPGARAAVKQGRRIGVISTPATAKSNAYQRAIAEIDSQVQVWQVGCPQFVPLIEQDLIDTLYTKQVAREYLLPLIEQKIDTLVYGCTHYRHLEKVFLEILPRSVSIIDPAESIAKAANQELELMGLKNDRDSIAALTRFYVSGCPEQFAQLSRKWLGYLPLVEKIPMPEALTPEITNSLDSFA